MKLIIVTNNDLFFKLFPVRVTINNTTLYILKNKKVIKLSLNEASFWLHINNGYHFVKPLHLHFPQEKYIALRIETYWDNVRIFSILVIALLLWGFAFTTSSSLFQVLANLPILFVIGYTIFNRKKIILVNKLQNPTLSEESYERFNYV